MQKTIRLNFIRINGAVNIKLFSRSVKERPIKTVRNDQPIKRKEGFSSFIGTQPGNLLRPKRVQKVFKCYLA